MLSRQALETVSTSHPPRESRRGGRSTGYIPKLTSDAGGKGSDGVRDDVEHPTQVADTTTAAEMGRAE